jgi:Cu-Zn family superoxide dismutase
MGDLAGQGVGTVSFAQAGGQVRVSADLLHLPPGFHGFHIHAVGDCDPATGFESAGPHLNPTGGLHPDHAGDLPSIYVNRDGTAALSFTTSGLTLADLVAAGGRAVIIHAERDNSAHLPTRYGVMPDATTLATGDTGDPIACGVIAQPTR